MAYPRFRGSEIWWRRLGRRIAVIALGFTIIMFVISLTSDSRRKGIDSNPPSTASDSDLVHLTLLTNAKNRGAVCLDGSSPGYHLQKGFGSGSNNWLLHIEGGGWCKSVLSCSSRKTTRLGSSNYMEHQVPFSGIFSHELSQNPDFYNWNKVKIRYCDGGSFSGNSEYKPQNGTILFFRGRLIWQAIMDELLSLGLVNASQALLTGCSAGGLATLIHCDDFQARLPKSANVKCLADGSLFLDKEDVTGRRTMRSFYHDVVNLQGIEKSLRTDCVSHMEPSQCFFPKQIIENIKTPLFIVHSAYDVWQIQHILVPDAADPHNQWFKCKMDIRDCSSDQIKRLHGFRNAMLDALSLFQHKKDWGLFISSCFIHCQTWMTSTWHSPHSPRINNKTIAEAVGDWYFNRREVKLVDCPYPCNPTCCNIVFSILGE
eukprot:TRINITY_DN2606_c0_g2_i1.p1 TRINITY_DN2606_c0_g2~~TRINITY_DN2606_c0_g2_i1.p1  ORF type:complete len:460 (+),score=56.38 TRINITY_DN2606_c0_g2_i1:93-1382(+)